MAVKVITDSTSYIKEEIMSQLNIGLVSLSVTIAGENIREVEISHEEFYQRLAKVDEIPTSSQPAIGEIYQAFEQAIKEQQDVLGIFISDKMSGTFQTAQLVREQVLAQYPQAQIRVLDSTTNSMQLGHIVIEAAKAAKEGNEDTEKVDRYLTEDPYVVLT